MYLLWGNKCYCTTKDKLRLIMWPIRRGAIYVCQTEMCRYTVECGIMNTLLNNTAFMA